MAERRINGVTYSYESEGDGRPLLLLHGFTGSSRGWTAHTAVFARYFRTIALDILGHGYSDSPSDEARYTMERVGADVVALLDALTAEPVHLLGYSMGGRLALYLALTYPHRFRSLVLESASPGLDSAEARQARIEQDRALANWIEAHDMEAFVDRWEQLPLWQSQAQLPPATRTNLRQQRLRNNPTGLANSLRGMGTGMQPALWPRLSELRRPVLLLAGELDPKFEAIGRQMAATMPDARLVLAPEAGHAIHLERPEWFQEQVLDFLMP